MRRSFLSASLIALCPAVALAEPAGFETPNAAVAAVVEALEGRDRDRLVAIFGPESESVILSGDPGRDRADWVAFYEAYQQMHRIVPSDDGTEAVLYIGQEQWPFPIPVRLSSGVWQFDPAAGAEEITARRIGENELDVIELMRDYTRVQAAFRQIDYDNDGIMEFAEGILSDPGERNGLYWPPEAGTPESPIGDFVARAAAAGYTVNGVTNEPEPFLGYYYKLLTEQGEGAPGGAHNYLVNGSMVGGHALIAFPSAYGETGIMSFKVGENGVVYEADLGEDTLTLGAATQSYNPVDPWTPVAE
ncbi:MAG: DUF2950 family protein [Pseudomonadota bacterium]